ncbi:MAG: hypothetical protein ABIF87_16700 [Pseudomonadota bacterium]
MDSIKEKFLHVLIKECGSDVDRIIGAAKARFNYVFSKEDVISTLESGQGSAASEKTNA